MFELNVNTLAAVEMPLPPIDIVKVKIAAIGTDARTFGAAVNAELGASCKEIMPNEMPIAVYDAIKKAVIVYPNIVLPNSDILTGTVSSKYCDLFSVKFYNEIVTDITAKRWDDPETALGRTVTTTMARFLTKLLPKSTADNLIRDMAQRLEDSLAPPKLLYARTPDEWKEMFTCNAISCMKVGNYQYVKKVPGEEFYKKGKWVSEYYSYWPNTTGVYIKKNDAVVARAVLYKADPKDDKYVGHSFAYGVTEPFKTALNTELNKICPVLMTYAPISDVFTGPVHDILNGRYAIHCSCDNISNSDLYMCYDKTNDVIMYGKRAQMPVGACSVHALGFGNNGFISIKELYQYDGVRKQQQASA